MEGSKITYCAPLYLETTSPRRRLWLIASKSRFIVESNLFKEGMLPLDSSTVIRHKNTERPSLAACLETLRSGGAKVVLIEKQAPQALCEALEGAGYAVARMDILSTRRANEGAEGYFEAQRANAATLKEAIAAGEDIP